MNYLQHTEEMDGKAYKPAEPVIFLKADSSLLKDRKPFFIPDFMGQIDYETEIVVRISRLGKGITERFAHRYYDAVTVGIDFTAREMQKKCREQGLPLDICKGLDGAACIGEWVELATTLSPKGKRMTDNTEEESTSALDINNLRFHLDINGKTVQTGCTNDMLYKIDAIIAYISKFYTLKTGDMIFTGTPAGVGPVHINDHLEGFLEGKKVLEFNCK